MQRPTFNTDLERADCDLFPALRKNFGLIFTDNCDAETAVTVADNTGRKPLTRNRKDLPTN
jgi:hypothetical protein